MHACLHAAGTAGAAASKGKGGEEVGAAASRAAAEVGRQAGIVWDKSWAGQAAAAENMPGSLLRGVSLHGCRGRHLPYMSPISA